MYNMAHLVNDQIINYLKRTLDNPPGKANNVAVGAASPAAPDIREPDGGGSDLQNPRIKADALGKNLIGLILKPIDKLSETEGFANQHFISGKYHGIPRCAGINI